MTNFLNDLMGMQPAASAHAAQIDWMLELLHWFVLVLFIGWTIFFVYTLVRFSAKRNPKADYRGLTNPTYKYTEYVVIACDVIFLIVLAIPLWVARVNEFPSKEGALQVRAIGEQFKWTIHYPGPDGKMGKVDFKFVDKNNPLGRDMDDPNGKDDVVILDLLHVPLNKTVIINVSSKDVIHSFKILQMRVCQDAMPGLSIPLWFKPTKEGKYEIVCAQLCGLGHYGMRGFCTVESQAEFDKWITEKAKAGPGGSYE